MIFSKIQVQFRIRIHNLELRIRILQKVSDPYGSGSTTLVIRLITTCFLAFLSRHPSKPLKKPEFEL
jgi:hypothetical protein